MMFAALMIAYGVSSASFAAPGLSSVAMRQILIPRMLAERTTWPANGAARSDEDLLEEADFVFDRLDLNADGNVSSEELRHKMASYEKMLVDKVFTGMDEDKNGGVSRAEFRKAYALHNTLRISPGLGGDLKREPQHH